MSKWDKLDKVNKSVEQFIAEPTTLAINQLRQNSVKQATQGSLKSIHLKLDQQDVEFLDKDLTQALRSSGQEQWQGNIYRPQLIHYLIEFYKQHQD